MRLSRNMRTAAIAMAMASVMAGRVMARRYWRAEESPSTRETAGSNGSATLNRTSSRVPKRKSGMERKTRLTTEMA